MKQFRHIDGSYKSLQLYFTKMFQFLDEVEIEEQGYAPLAEDIASNECQQESHVISHLVKPDMIINTYSFLDYWLSRICDCSDPRGGEAQWRKIYKTREEDDLWCRNRYLSRQLKIDFKSVRKEYDHLQNLRVIRNCLVHNGGHVTKEEERKAIAKHEELYLFHTQIVIGRKYVWESLESAYVYLKCASKA